MGAPEPLTRERIRLQSCRNADTCPCDHVYCCDGWLIQDVDDQGPARRCPTCYDTVLMKVEEADRREAEVRRGRKWHP